MAVSALGPCAVAVSPRPERPSRGTSRCWTATLLPARRRLCAGSSAGRRGRFHTGGLTISVTAQALQGSQQTQQSKSTTGVSPRTVRWRNKLTESSEWRQRHTTAPRATARHLKAHRKPRRPDGSGERLDLLHRSDGDHRLHRVTFRGSAVRSNGTSLTCGTTQRAPPGENTDTWSAGQRCTTTTTRTFAARSIAPSGDAAGARRGGTRTRQQPDVALGSQLPVFRNVTVAAPRHACRLPSSRPACEPGGTVPDAPDAER